MYFKKLVMQRFATEWDNFDVPSIMKKQECFEEGITNKNGNIIVKEYVIFSNDDKLETVQVTAKEKKKELKQKKKQEEQELKQKKKQKLLAAKDEQKQDDDKIETEKLTLWFNANFQVEAERKIHKNAVKELISTTLMNNKLTMKQILKKINKFEIFEYNYSCEYNSLGEMYNGFWIGFGIIDKDKFGDNFNAIEIEIENYFLKVFNYNFIKLDDIAKVNKFLFENIKLICYPIDLDFPHFRTKNLTLKAFHEWCKEYLQVEGSTNYYRVDFIFDDDDDQM